MFGGNCVVVVVDFWSDVFVCIARHFFFLDRSRRSFLATIAVSFSGGRRRKDIRHTFIIDFVCLAPVATLWCVQTSKNATLEDTIRSKACIKIMYWTLEQTYLKLYKQILTLFHQPMMLPRKLINTVMGTNHWLTIFCHRLLFIDYRLSKNSSSSFLAPVFLAVDYLSRLGHNVEG